MKKIITVLLAALILTVLASCGHGQHVYSALYSFDDENHWLECTQEGCGEKSAVEPHEWQSGEVKNPTSDEAGSQTYVCAKCKKTDVRTIEKLPDRMSQGDWSALFKFDSVCIEVENGRTNVIYEIDGDVLKVTTDYEMIYSFSDLVYDEIDFTDNYTDFSHYGDGVYKCDKLTWERDDLVYDYSDLCIKVSDGRISEIDLTATLKSDTYNVKYLFSSWDDVDVTLPTLTSSQLSAAVREENFKNFTLEYQTFNKNTNESAWLVKYYAANRYLIKDLLNTETEDVYGENENAPEITTPVFFEILSLVTSDKFKFDVGSNRFVYTGSITLADGTVIDSLSMIIESGYVKAISTYQGEIQTHYMLKDYGSTVIDSIE